MPILGKINYYYTGEISKRESGKVVGWRPKWDNQIEPILQANQQLREAGIRHFLIYSDNGIKRLTIRISKELNPLSFCTSDDPEVWQAIQKKKEDQKKIKEVTKKLDRS